MTSIKLKPHKLFGLWIFLLSILLGGMGTLFLFIGVSDNVLWSLIAGVFLFLWLIYLVVVLFKNTPSVTVDDLSITFNKQRFQWEDLIEMSVLNKKSLRLPDWMDRVLSILSILLIFSGETNPGGIYNNDPIPVTVFRFKNGIVKRFSDKNYTNTAEVKDFIRQAIINRAVA